MTQGSYKAAMARLRGGGVSIGHQCWLLGEDEGQLIVRVYVRTLCEHTAEVSKEQDGTQFLVPRHRLFEYEDVTHEYSVGSPCFCYFGEGRVEKVGLVRTNDQTRPYAPAYQVRRPTTPSQSLSRRAT